MKIETILNLLVLILGIVVAITPWAIAPVCMVEMRCWLTRDIETVLGAIIALLGFVGMFRSLQ